MIFRFRLSYFYLELLKISYLMYVMLTFSKLLWSNFYIMFLKHVRKKSFKIYFDLTIKSNVVFKIILYELKNVISDGILKQNPNRLVRMIG